MSTAASKDESDDEQLDRLFRDLSVSGEDRRRPTTSSISHVTTPATRTQPSPLLSNTAASRPFYLVSAGKEVGAMKHWYEAGDATQGVPGSQVNKVDTARRQGSRYRPLPPSPSPVPSPAAPPRVALTQSPSPASPASSAGPLPLPYYPYTVHGLPMDGAAIERALANPHISPQAPPRPLPAPHRGAVYVVARGKVPGVYLNYPDCLLSIKGVSGAVYQKYATLHHGLGAWSIAWGAGKVGLPLPRSTGGPSRSEQRPAPLSPRPWYLVPVSAPSSRQQEPRPIVVFKGTTTGVFNDWWVAITFLKKCADNRLGLNVLTTW
ncbi:hypothetical protein PLICRDRAFT_174159 [Plicaturopsis crispa FD-325 SS-3]|nr:hypothetical protein PLICRDRAFT_174159 [Plicaturopsis crispa FD-325 SS-3]